MNAAARNARRLAEDARFLFENHRFPSAASLAVLSIEESGKSPILRHLSVASSDKEVRDRWGEYRSHSRKNVIGGLVDIVARGARRLDDFGALFSEDAEHPYVLDQLKQLGFYTDCLGAAHWSEPEGVIDERLAEQLVRTAEILASAKEISVTEIELWIKHLAPVWNKDSGWMRKALENWYDDMQGHGLASKGENAMRNFIRDGVSLKGSSGNQEEKQAKPRRR